MIMSVIYSTAKRSLHRHLVCGVPVSCKANGVGNQLGAWRYSVLLDILYFLEKYYIWGKMPNEFGGRQIRPPKQWCKYIKQGLNNRYNPSPYCLNPTFQASNYLLWLFVSDLVGNHGNRLSLNVAHIAK